MGVGGCRKPGITGHGADDRDDLVFPEPGIETGIAPNLPVEET